MNEQNYASLEASKKLVKAGIVLETDAYWVEFPSGAKLYSYRPSESELAQYSSYAKVYPAACFTEVWRELPQGFEYDGERTFLCITKSRKKDGTTYAAYFLPEDKAVCGSKMNNVNPTDALIDLLIWVRKEKP